MIKIYPAKEVTACNQCPDFWAESFYKGCRAMEDVFPFAFDHETTVSAKCPLENKDQSMSIKPMSVEEIESYIDSGEMQDLLSLLTAHQQFADECKKRLIEKWRQGYSGSDVTALESRLLEKSQLLTDPSIAANEQMKVCVDIANFAMMIHHQA